MGKQNPILALVWKDIKAKKYRDAGIEPPTEKDRPKLRQATRLGQGDGIGHVPSARDKIVIPVLENGDKDHSVLPTRYKGYDPVMVPCPTPLAKGMDFGRGEELAGSLSVAHPNPKRTLQAPTRNYKIETIPPLCEPVVVEKKITRGDVGSVNHAVGKSFQDITTIPRQDSLFGVLSPYWVIALRRVGVKSIQDLLSLDIQSLQDSPQFIWDKSDKSLPLSRRMIHQMKLVAREHLDSLCILTPRWFYTGKPVLHVGLSMIEPHPLPEWKIVKKDK